MKHPAVVAARVKVRREKGTGRQRDRWWLNIPGSVAALLPSGGMELKLSVSRYRAVFWASSSTLSQLSARLWVSEDHKRGTIGFPSVSQFRLNDPPVDVGEGFLFLDAKHPDGLWDFRLRWE